MDTSLRPDLNASTCFSEPALADLDALLKQTELLETLNKLFCDEGGDIMK